MKRITVIVPTLLLDKSLVLTTERAISSLTSARHHAHLVIVDDYSPIRVPSDWGDKVLRTPRRLGYPGAVNWGIQAVSSDYICVANNDIIVAPGSLDVLLDALERTSAGVVCARPGRPFIDLKAHPREQAKDFFGGLWLLSRTTLQVVGLLDEQFSPFYFEDTDLWTRLQMIRLKLVQDYRVGVYHIEGATTRRLGYRERVFWQNRKKFYVKWGFDGLRRFHSLSLGRILDFIIPDTFLK